MTELMIAVVVCFIFGVVLAFWAADYANKYAKDSRHPIYESAIEQCTIGAWMFSIVGIVLLIIVGTIKLLAASDGVQSNPSPVVVSDTPPFMDPPVKTDLVPSKPQMPK